MAAREHREIQNIENKKRKWSHSSLEKLPLVRMSASWFLVSTYLIWILGSKIDSVEQPIKSNSVGSWHVSHCRTSPVDYHFVHGFAVFKDVQLRFTLRGMCVSGYVIHLTQLVILLLSFNSWGLGFGIKNCPSFLVACMFGVNIVIIVWT